MTLTPETPLTAPVDLRIPGLATPLQLYTHGARDRVVSGRIRETGIWEPYETSLLQRLLRPGDVFVDVGANIGYFTVLGAALVGAAGRVFAFEPDPDNFRLLQANLALNGLADRAEATEAALSDVDANGTLYLSADNLGDHQVYPTADEPRESRPITLRNGSELLRARTDRIDLLKVDTQGAEHAVLEGLLPLLRSLAAPPRILVELTPWSLRQAGATGRALIEMLASLGLPMHIVDHVEHRLVESTPAELATWCDNVDAWDDDRGFMNILVGAAA